MMIDSDDWVNLANEIRERVDRYIGDAVEALEQAAGWAYVTGETDLSSDLTRFAGQVRHVTEHRPRRVPPSLSYEQQRARGLLDE